KSVPRPDLCYANGRVRYRLRRVVREHNGEKLRIVYYMEGSLDNLTKIKRTYKLPRSTEYYWKWNFNKYTCRSIKRPPTVPDGQVWMMLKPNHGYLTYVRKGTHSVKYTAYFYHPSGSESIIPLPFDSRD